MVEQWTFNPLVVGSSPTCPIYYFFEGKNEIYIRTCKQWLDFN